MPIRFDQPWLLLLIVLIVPIVLIGMRSMQAYDRLRRWSVILLRSLVMLTLAIILAGPSFRQTHNHVTVIGLLDVSGSVRRFADLPTIPELELQTNLEYLRHWFRQAVEMREPDDRFGMIVFDGRAIAISVPTRGDYPDDQVDLATLEGTNIAEAIELGLAMLPSDTARRLVLISDGNETTGSALAAAREAAGRTGDTLSAIDASTIQQQVSIDVVPLAYRIDRDVQVVRVEAPATARPDQVITLRVVLEAIQPTEGRLTILREQAPIDLDPDDPGFAREISLPAGQSVHLVRVALGNDPINRFEAIFEPALPTDDELPENNRAESIVATPGRGAILLVRSGQTSDNALEATLRDANLRVDVVPSSRIPTDLLQLQAYDLVILQNIPAYEVTEPLQETIARYVNDFGGGLIMVGGEDSFGAGGWNGTAIEHILPVELDLPKEMRLTKAALVLVIDKSGSMGMRVAGSRATQQEVANRGTAAAIQSLQPESLVGVVVFDSFSRELIPLSLNDNPQQSMQEVLSILPSGGTSMGPALERAHAMLNAVDVKNKYVVVLSDGRSDGRSRLNSIVANMTDDNINVSSIAVGDSADDEMLEQIATIGNGEFYDVIDPATLPSVLVDSVQVVNKPLIKEVTFVPVALPTGSALAAEIVSADTPPLKGLVLTAPRNNPLVTMEMVTPEGEPLLAHWQAGLGRTAAFTSDASQQWAGAWLPWSGYATFWTQLARTIARPPMSQEYELTTNIRDGQLHIQLDATSPDDGYLDYLTIEGSVYTPSGDAIDIRLRQTGPGRYATSLNTTESGNYVIALTPRKGTRALAPIIGGINQPAGQEFRRYASNVSLLQQVMETTGGRQLDVEQPQATNLFDRTDLPPSVSLLPSWQKFLWFLLAVFLLDVACRRIAWDKGTILAWWQRATAKVSMTRKADESQATLETLRTRSTEISAQRQHDSRAVEKLQADSSFKTPGLAKQSTNTSTASKKSPATTSFSEYTDEAQRQARRSALNKLSGRKSKSTSSKKDQKSSKSDLEKELPASNESETAASRLAAKRRRERGK